MFQFSIACVSTVQSSNQSYAEHIVHESASAWADLDELDALLGSALADPFGDKPDAHEFAKDLRDLGRGNEIPLAAELVSATLPSACVIATEVGGETHTHITGQGDGARGLGCHE